MLNRESDVRDTDYDLIAKEAAKMREEYGDDAERYCELLLDSAVGDPNRWSTLYRVKELLTATSRLAQCSTQVVVK